MIVRSLQPVRSPHSELDEIEKRLKRLYLELVFRPILRGEKLGEFIENAIQKYSGIEQGLRAGRITFNNGIFSGKFNASISKELKALGAKWDFQNSVFKIQKQDLPDDVIRAINLAESTFVKKLTNIDTKIAKVLYEKPWEQFNFSDLFDKSIFKMDKEFRKNVETISIQPEVSEYQAKKISEDWQRNFETKIKAFSEEKMVELREKVKDVYFSGNRYGSLVQVFKDSYGVTERKAEFWARNEMRSLVATYQGAQYVEAGIPGYHWKAVVGTPAHPTRHRHAELSRMSDKGEIFYWADPPRVSEDGAKGKKVYANPGQTYNCRCSAIPVHERKK